jgi:hypothetical protein
MRSLEDDLRNGFLLFCNKAPELAKGYLQMQQQRRRNHDTTGVILKFRGALAQAAPAELVELTVKALISERRQDKSRYHHEFREPFGHYDQLFVPASPAQGPFYELLTHAPNRVWP